MQSKTVNFSEKINAQSSEKKRLNESGSEFIGCAYKVEKELKRYCESIALSLNRNV